MDGVGYVSGFWISLLWSCDEKVFITLIATILDSRNLYSMQKNTQFFRRICHRRNWGSFFEPVFMGIPFVCLLLPLIFSISNKSIFCRFYKQIYEWNFMHWNLNLFFPRWNYDTPLHLIFPFQRIAHWINNPSTKHRTRRWVILHTRHIEGSFCSSEFCYSCFTLIRVYIAASSAPATMTSSLSLNKTVEPATQRRGRRSSHVQPWPSGRSRRPREAHRNRSHSRRCKCMPACALHLAITPMHP